MDQITLNKLVRTLKVQFALFFILPLFLFVLGEFSTYDLGVYVNDAGKTAYYLQTFTVLFTMISVPLALKAFHWILTNKVDKTNEMKAIRSYKALSAIRLIILQLATLSGLIVYYTTQNNIGGFCALIAITATLFCVPSKNKAQQELAVATESNESESIERNKDE